MKNNQKGFAHLGLIVIVVLILGAAGFAGYRVLNKNEPTTNNSSNTTSSQSGPKQEESQYSSLKLADEKVQFAIPKAWILGKSNCIDSPGAAPNCVDGATLTPPEKMPTIYGDGTEYFTIYVNVYDNPGNKSAQMWFEETYMGGLPNEDDEVSNENINGYDTYYFRQIDTSYDEIRYVYSADNKAVLVMARIAEKHSASDGSGRVNNSSDFTKYIPDIEKMVKTVKID